MNIMAGRQNSTTSLKEAIAKVKPGMTIGLSGFSYMNPPMVFVREIIRKGIKNLTIVVNGVSKTYSMTGWRIGYCAGDKDIIKEASQIQSHSTSNPTSIAQWASVEALRGPQHFIERMKFEFKERSPLQQLANLVFFRNPWQFNNDSSTALLLN